MKATVFDVSKFYVSPIVLEWMGQEATEFYERHKAELIPGRSLRVEVFHFISKQNEFNASVKTCEMAPPPPSWIKHAEKMNSAKPANPPTPGLRLV